jgi:alpha-beta hydrolase superfamily lysophospholipase
LVLAGKEDRITPLFVQRKIADKYKELATYREFSDHAHWLIAEKGWESIVGYADDWLRNLKV